ncbi:predicted protein [Coccidioides posadasii str. Silveira]|uniref:Predicted protein n=1 Tax=Coccidioides posadasii (strain RMSCC 757 / Silveira) TaxID=443226 RepID=E9CY68_COCPS|nr:predicted protein [Coccidioides posadasii str. Silveira]
MPSTLCVYANANFGVCNDCGTKRPTSVMFLLSEIKKPTFIRAQNGAVHCWVLTDRLLKE